MPTVVDEQAPAPTLVESPKHDKYFNHEQCVAGPGRPAGSRNRVSTTAKKNIQAVFDGLGSWESMLEWARENKDTFYGSVYPRLLATEADSKGSGPIRVLVYAPQTPSDKPLEIINVLTDPTASTQEMQAEEQAEENKP